MPRTGNNVLCKPTVDICRSCMTGQCGCVRLSATAHRVKLVNWCFEPGQPLGIISGLKETFITKHRVERTNNAETRPEEQSEKTESCLQNVWNKIQLKDR